ncbi:VOC family protein [Jannaschia sp. CCS1]|uniref:VOC family protein n=1 Tax=Jannaschia sp. (strain CCS1) TaxID=290400 RepID=UPI000053CBB2|nr:VOC family protein [Jannaschia sp. CCS1]ABD57009.1 Glyoxalase/bleomycin resistance protein/dioxygenase [Jannaschia sp. CCS1]
MRFVNPLPFVDDIETSKSFYSSVLGLSIIQDHGNFVLFDTGFAIHDGKSLFKSVFGQDDTTASPYGRRNLVLYFEDLALDAAFERISPRVQLIHEVRLEPWGQRLFRLFDPDRHVVEIGEPTTQ